MTTMTTAGIRNLRMLMTYNMKVVIGNNFDSLFPYKNIRTTEGLIVSVTLLRQQCLAEKA